MLESIGGKGERARLFPVLSEGSRERRTLSVLLACLTQVPEFSRSFLESMGRRVGTRTHVEAYTEVIFPKRDDGANRPDGLLAVSSGRSVWRAFIEAKVGNNKLKPEQIENYLRLARDVGVDALITISNDFAALPEHHPLDIDKRLLKKISLYHFSWFSFLTTMNVLSEDDQVEDADHVFLLDELERFLVHPSAGLQRFTQMGPEWTIILDRIRSNVKVQRNSREVQAAVACWHSELRDLCLLATRKTGVTVGLKLPLLQRSNARARVLADCNTLSMSLRLSATLNVPDTASPLALEVNLATRTILASARLDAPQDKTRQGSRLSWITRQLKDADQGATHILSHWPGRAVTIESSLAEALDDASIHSHPDHKVLPRSFTVLMRMADGRKFAGRKTFISTLEELTLDFYDSVLSKLKAWQPAAPQLRAAVEEEPQMDNPET